MVDDVVLFEFIKQQLVASTAERSDSALRQARIISSFADVANKPRCIKMLMNECEQYISPYDYEGIPSFYTELLFFYQFIIQHDEQADRPKKAMLVLDILKDYTRTKPPTDSELNPKTSVLNEIYTVSLKSVTVLLIPAKKTKQDSVTISFHYAATFGGP